MDVFTHLSLLLKLQIISKWMLSREDCLFTDLEGDEEDKTTVQYGSIWLSHD